MRRCQQDELYAAERVLQAFDSAITVEDAQRLVDSWRDLHWWNAQGYWACARIEVVNAPNLKKSQAAWDPTSNAGLIELAPGRHRLRTVLHEAAHVLAGALFGSTSHDPYFARIYCHLAYNVLGSEAWLALQASFDQHGVNYLQTGVVS